MPSRSKSPTPSKSTRRKRATASPAKVQRQLGELAVAVPQVVAARVTRMALAGPQPNARDRAEFHRMGAEKVRAFQASGLAMMQSWATQQQQWWMAWMQLAASPWWLRANAGASSWQALAERAGRMPWGAASQAIAPVHRTAVANARRLGGFFPFPG